MAKQSPEEKLFSSIKKSKILITSFSGLEGGHIKKYFYSKHIANVDEIKDSEEAWEKLELATYHFIIINVDNQPAGEILSKIVDSHRFEKTPIFIFSKVPDVFRESYKKREMIGRFLTLPLNIGTLEKELLEAIKSGVFEKSRIGHLSKALEHYKNGARAFEENRLDEAMNEIKLCLKTDPNFIDGYLKMAEILIEKGELETAMRILKKGAKLDPNKGRIFYTVGLIMAEKEEITKAMSAFDKALALEPNNVQLTMDIGNICLEKNWIDEALFYFGSVKKKHPDFLYVYNRIGIALSRMGRYDEAEEEYNKALKLDGQNAGVHFNVGMLWHRRKNKEKAEEYFKKALKLDSSLGEAEKMLRKIGTR